MIITAKFASCCPLCNGDLRVGDQVEWTKGEKAKHPSCAKVGRDSSKTARGKHKIGR